VTGLDLAGRDAFLVKLDDPFVGLDVDDTSWEWIFPARSGMLAWILLMLGICNVSKYEG
jgi:hypothetical protein